MDRAFEALMLIALVASLLAPLGAILVYGYWLAERRIRLRNTLMQYVLGVALSGVIPGYLGKYVGAYLTCAAIQDRNCGFGGALVGAPLAFAIGMSCFIYFWALRHPRPNSPFESDAIRRDAPHGAPQRER